MELKTIELTSVDSSVMTCGETKRGKGRRLVNRQLRHIRLLIFGIRCVHAAYPFAVLHHALLVGHGLKAGEQAALWQVILRQEVLVDVVLQPPACVGSCGLAAGWRSSTSDGQEQHTFIFGSPQFYFHFFRVLHFFKTCSTAKTWILG